MLCRTLAYPTAAKPQTGRLRPPAPRVPAEYALPEVIPIRGHTRPPPIESVGEQMDRDRNEEEADAASQRGRQPRFRISSPPNFSAR